MYSYTLPSGIDAEIREMTGVEEDLLTNERLMRDGSAVNRVLKNCLTRLGENQEPSMQEVMDLLAGDRLFLLVRLRQVSLGEEVELSLKCPNRACLAENPVTVRLDELAVTPYGGEREFTFQLPRSGQTIRFGLLDGHKEKRMTALKEPDISALMLMRILDVGGNPPSKKWIRELPLKDRSALREEMRKRDGGIETAVLVDCSSCGATIQTRMETEADFLFPGTG